MKKRLEKSGHHFVAEIVVAGRHGSMRREHRARRHRFERGGKTQSSTHQCTRPLQHHERRMSLIDVPYCRLDSDLPQSSDTPHAEENFLLDTHHSVSAIELVSDITIVRRILGKIGIEKIQLDMADFGVPYLRLHGTTRQLDMNANLRAIVP